MRYIDTGSRDPREAVGNWLEAITASGDISELRVQSGYVGPQPLGYLEQVLGALSTLDGKTSILVGSNGGETDHETVEDLLLLAGPPRPHLQLGVVAFSDGLFHPKVYHFVRTDGSMAAYVGSANLTYSGISGKNVEAGVILDTAEGDDPIALSSVLDAIDGWFREPRPGFFSIRTTADLPQLVADGVLGAPRPARKTPRITVGGTASRLSSALVALVRLPAISKVLAVPLAPPAPGVPAIGVGVAPVPPPFVEWWSKTLPASDAQRKQSGNQSGVIALTQADRRGEIDQTSFFRNDLFGGLLWQQTPTRTGHMMDAAQVRMHTTVLGAYLGVLPFEVTHDHFREQQRSNYTAKLALGPIRDRFAQIDMTGTSIEIGRDAAGAYWLQIR
ncbi:MULTISPECIES: phospholipase D family protein [unclassified Actinotalea]|uniref:phospholipase D family protein n=1 Tax=unclassified Actinotalea TaxID=2638618 RepID=UPI0015F67267|nr:MULTISPECIES: phospholipase D family protein [unclassified Actinotalea]